jgi:glycerol dehydrogenase
VEKRHPRHYVQASGAITGIAPLLGDAGSLVIAGRQAWKAVRGALEPRHVVSAALARPEPVQDSSSGELARLTDLAKRAACRRVIAIGGGRVIDLGKACATKTELPCTVVPTVLGSDAACSSVSVIYDDQGQFLEYLDAKRNPERVVVDLQILRASPGRYFAAGIVGALSVFFEVEELLASGGFSAGHSVTQHYLDSARRGRRRLLALEPAHLREPARLSDEDLDDAVFLSLWASADLFENVGLYLAHAVYRGLRGMGLSGPNGYLHGELVGLGLLCQLSLSRLHGEQRKRVGDFVKSCLQGTYWKELHTRVSAGLHDYREELGSFWVGDPAICSAGPERVAEVTLEVLAELI